MEGHRLKVPPDKRTVPVDRPNVTGDAVATTIVAKHEKLLDLDKFKARA